MPNEAADDPLDVQTTSKTDPQSDRNSVPISFQPIDIVSNTIGNQKQSKSQNGSVVALEKNALSPDPPEPLFNNSDVLELPRRVKREENGIPDVLDMFQIVNTSKFSYLNIPVLDGIGKAIETMTSSGWTSRMEDEIFGSLHQFSELKNMVIFKRFLKKLQGGVSLDLFPFAEHLRDLASSIGHHHHPRAMKTMASSGWTSGMEYHIFDSLFQLSELQNIVTLKRVLKNMQGGVSLDLLPYAEQLRDLASSIDNLRHHNVLRTAIETFDMLYTERFLRDLTGFHSPIDVSRYRQRLRNLIEPLRYQYKTHDLQTFVDRLLGSYQKIITQIGDNELVSFMKVVHQDGEKYSLHLSRFQALLRGLVTMKNSTHFHQDFDVWMGQLHFFNSSLGQYNQTISGTPASETDTDQNITLHSVKRRQVPSQPNKKGNFTFLNHFWDLSTEVKQKINHVISKFASATLFDMMQALRRKDEPLQNLRGLSRFHRLTSGLESYQNMNYEGKMLLAINKFAPQELKKRLHGSKESKREVSFSQENLSGDFSEKYRNETSKHRLLSFLHAILRITPNISSSRNNNRLLELATHMSDSWFGDRRNEDSLYYLLRKMNYVQPVTEEYDIIDFLKHIREHSFSRSDVNSPQMLANVMVRFISRGGLSNNTTLGNLLKLIWFPQHGTQNKTFYQTVMDILQTLNHTSHNKDVNMKQELSKSLMALIYMYVEADLIPSFEPPSDPNLALIDFLLRHDARKNPEIDRPAFHSLARLITSLQMNSSDLLTIQDFLQKLGWFPQQKNQNKTIYQTLMDIVHSLNHTSHRKDVNMMQELSKNLQLLKEGSSVNNRTLARFDDLMALVYDVGDEIPSFEPPSDPNSALINFLFRNDASKNPEIDPQAFHSLARLITSLQRNSSDVFVLQDLLQELSLIGQMYESEEKATPHMDFLDAVRYLVPNTKFNGSKDLAIFANIMRRARYSRNSIMALDHVLNALKSLQEDNLEGFYPVLQNMTLVDFLQLPVSLPSGDLGSIQDLANITNHIPVTNNTDLHVLQQIIELLTQSQDKGDQISLHPLVHLFQSLGDNNHIKDNVQELLNLTMITKHLHTISPDSRKISDILNTLQYIFEENSDQSVVEGDELNFIDILDSLINSREDLDNVSQMAWNEFDGSLDQIIAGAASQRLENIGNFDELLRVVFHSQHLQDFPEKSDRLADIIGSLGRITDEESANGINPDLEMLNKLFSNLQSNVSTVEVLKHFLLDLEALQSGTSYQESTNPHIAMSFMDSLLHILPSNEIFDRGITNLQFLTKLIQDSEGHQYKDRLPILAQFLRDIQHLQMTPYLEDFDLSPGNISYADFLQLLGDGGFSEDEVISMQQLANLTNHFDNGNASDEFLHLVKLLDLLQPPQKKTANEPEPPSYSLLNMFLNPRDRYDTIADMDELRGMIPLSELLNGPVKDMVVDEIRGLIDSNSNRHSLQIIKLVQFLRNAIHRGYHTSSGDMGMLQTLSTFASLWQANLTSSNAISYENLLKDLGNIENDQQYLGQGDTEPLVHFLISALGNDNWNPVEFDRLSHFADMLENVSTAINTSEVQRMMMDMWFKPPQHPDERYLKFFSDMQSNARVLSHEHLVKLNELVKAHADGFKEHDPNVLPDVLSIIGGSKDERLSSLMHFLVSQQFPDSYEPNDILMMQNVVNITKRFIPTLTDENVAEITKLFTSQVDHQEPITEYLRLMLALRDAVAANRSLDVLMELKSLTKGLPPLGDRGLRYENMTNDIQDLLRLFDTRNTDKGDILSFIDTLANEPYQPSWPWSNSILPKLKDVAFNGHLPKNLGDDMLSSFGGIFGQSRTGANDQLMSLLDDVKETDDYQPSSIDVVAELDRHETIKQWMKDSKSALRSYLESVNDVLGSATQSNAASFLDFLDYTEMYKDADEFNRPILDLKNLSSIIPRPLGNARATTSIYEELLKQFGPEVPHPPLLAFVDALQEMFSQPDIDVSNDPTKLNKMGSYLENLPLPMTTALDDIHGILIKTKGAKSYLDYMEDMLTSLTGIGTGVLPNLESLQDLENNGVVDLLQRSSSPLVDNAILDDLDKLLGQKTSAEMFAAGLEATLQDEGMRNDIHFYQTSALLNNYQKDITKMVAFQQYFGDLGDIVDVISQYSTLKESIHKTWV